jgi:hypothetical protein
MTGYEICAGYWWLLPLLMFVLCFFCMRKGCGCSCGFGHRHDEKSPPNPEEKNHVL